MGNSIASHVTAVGLRSQGFSLPLPPQGSERSLRRQRKEGGEELILLENASHPSAVMAHHRQISAVQSAFKRHLCSSLASPPQ